MTPRPCGVGVSVRPARLRGWSVGRRRRRRVRQRGRVTFCHELGFLPPLRGEAGVDLAAATATFVDTGIHTFGTGHGSPSPGLGLGVLLVRPKILRDTIEKPAELLGVLDIDGNVECMEESCAMTETSHDCHYASCLEALRARS